MDGQRSINPGVIKTELWNYLSSIGHQPDHKGKLCCPVHNDRNPSANYDKIRFRIKCWSCNFHGDIFDIIEKRDGLSKRDAFLKAAEMFGQIQQQPTLPTIASPQPKKLVSASPEKIRTRNEYLEKCKASIHLTEYHLTRGLSDEYAKKVGLGYDPALDALVIPIDDGCFIRRICTPDAPRRYDNEKDVAIGLFNSQGLDSENQIFVVEGAIDALTIMTQPGYAAIALNSSGNASIFIERIRGKMQEGWKPARPLIIAMDGDNSGHESSIKLQEAMQALSVPFIVRELPEGTDFNSMLVSRGIIELQRTLRDWKYDVDDKLEAEAKQEQAEKDKYSQLANAWLLGELTDGLISRPPAISTGFEELDKRLSGGLHPMLHVLGAPPSLGKTSICVQMADNIASNGHDVLFMSIEVSALEINSKILSRRSKDSKCPVTSLDIISGKVMHEDHPAYVPYFETALHYTGSAAAEHMFVRDFEEPPTISSIRDAVANHIAMRGVAPVVFVDYMQIIAQPDLRMDMRLGVKLIASGLKSISKTFKTPVVVISSLNRASYNARGSFGSAKESGEIEYAADVLMFLQFRNVGSDKFDFETALKSDPRNVELAIAKQRYGAPGSVNLDFYPKYNDFVNPDHLFNPEDYYVH